MTKSLVAAIQMVSGDDIEVNLKKTQQLLEQAVVQGAKLIVLPENFALMARRSQQTLAAVETLGQGPIQSFIAQLARANQVWVIAGSIPIVSPEASRAYASCVVYDDLGKQVAVYNKIHLFDVDIPHKKLHFKESKTYYPGENPVVFYSPFGKIGLSICYDLRFPELFRKLLDLGASLLVAPAAFIHDTGLAHWELLCRTRALENLCYLIAPNQGGIHTNGRQTYGHSMIVDPWGKVLAEASGSGERVVLAEIDPAQQNSLRQSFPAVMHRKIND